MPVTIIHSKTLSTEQQQQIIQTLGAEPQPIGNHFQLEHNSLEGKAVSREDLQALRDACGVDINMLPDDFDSAAVRLLITDMDSTLISIECVDEIADFVGFKPQVAAITEAAMRGELDFASSLRQRVALLAGLDVSALQQVYDERLTLNPGAEALVGGLKSRQIKMALVSGGFTFFTERLEQRLGLDYTLANVEIQEGSLGIAQAQAEGGQVSEVDVRQAELIVANTQANVPAQQPLLARDPCGRFAREGVLAK